jgi:predicted CXXCH cytochrome family protein
MPKSNAAALLLALAVLAALAAPVNAASSEGGGGAGGHPSWTVETCLSCHRADEASSIGSRVARPCRTLCASCHEFRDGHHPVGVPIPRAVPAPLLLTKAGTNTCVTCHDTTRPRVDRAHWASTSLFERIVHRSGEHRTYLLAMRNDKGQLCRNCH